MRILQIVQTPLQFEPPVFALGTLLASQGHKVDCSGYWEPGLPFEEEIAPGYRLIRIPRGQWAALPRIFRGGGRYMNYRRGVIAHARQIVPDLVIPMNYDGLPIGVEIAKEVGCRLAYYCTEYTPTPGLREYLTGWGFVKRLERSLVQYPERLYSVEPNRATLQAADWGRPVDHVILNAPPFNAWIDEAAEAAIEGRDPADRVLRLVYAGSIGLRNCLSELLKAVLSHPGVHLDLCGRVVPGFETEFESMMKGVNAEAGERIRYCGEIAFATLAGFLVEHDFGITLYDGNHVNTRLASPAKLFQYMQAGLGIVTSNQPTPAEVVKKSGAGIVADLSVPGELVRLLSGLAGASSESRIGMRRSSLRAYRERFTYEHQAEPLLQWVRNTELGIG